MSEPELDLAAPPATKSERTRQGVLDAAAHLFASKGYADTSMSDIAAEAGIKAGSVYYHFASKDELVYEVLRFGVTHSFEHTRAEVERLGTGASASVQLRVAIHAHLESLHSLGDYASAGLGIVEQAPRAIRKKQYANQRHYGDYWHRLLERAQAESTLPSGIDLLSVRLFLFAAMNSTAAWPATARQSTADLSNTLFALVARP
jgi:TetR/AcrR family transcriptional regulator, cholesterol catabolism regulator